MTAASRRFAGLGAAFASLAIGVAPGSAAPSLPNLTVDKSFGKVSGWSIGYSEALGGCLAAATYTDGTTIWFGFSAVRGGAYLAFTNPKWRSVEAGRTYQVRLQARGGGGNWQGSFVGFERDGDSGLFSSGLKERFVSDLSNAGELSVGFGGRQLAALSLIGSTEAMGAVQDCQRGGGSAKAPTLARSEDGRSGERTGSQGTGFYVSEKGHVLTNHHVVDGCADITLGPVGTPPVKARLVASDAANDLAVLSTDTPQTTVPPFALRTRVGEDVYVFGFPLNGMLATTGNFTVGNVTATAGLGDDTRKIQISAPVQPGNSGGPLLDRYGNVVGVIVAKLNALKVANLTDDLAQNVNFAIKTTIVYNFLDANNIPASLDARTAEPMDGATIAEKAKAFTVRVRCR